MIPYEVMAKTLMELCAKHGLNIFPRPFQIEFFIKAVAGVSGFLEVRMTPISTCNFIANILLAKMAD